MEGCAVLIMPYYGRLCSALLCLIMEGCAVPYCALLWEVVQCLIVP